MSHASPSVTDRSRELLSALSGSDPPGFVLLVHAGTGAATIAERMGTADYSYYFVLEEFRPVLERIGHVVDVDDPAAEIDPLHRICRERDVPCLFLSFTPPHKIAVGLECPTIPVFAWEFSDLPDEMFEDDRSDWTHVLGRLGWAVTHSSFAADVVRSALRPDFPVEAIPAPVWDRFEGLRAEPHEPGRGSHRSPRIGGNVVDTHGLDLRPFASREVKQAYGFENPEELTPLPVQPGAVLEPGSVVYTSILNPYDDRKNWRDLIGVFCQVMRDVPDATLVVKLTHSEPWQACYSILEELYKSTPFACRVLLQHGFLDQEEYDGLIRSTDYAVNASHGEGQCLPLMEFMSSGRPAIAPDHTGLTDYVNRSNAFVVESTVEPAIWPHDPRQLFRTLRRRLNPESLARAYEDSYRVAKLEPERYRRMSTAAIRTLGRHASADVAAAKLRRLLGLRHGHSRAFAAAPATCSGAVRSRLSRATRRAADLVDRSRRNGAPADAGPPTSDLPPAHTDPRTCGLKDAVESGWYQETSGELITGFPITPEDRVLDVGCGEGGATHFCAKRGAAVIFVDIQRGKVAEAIRRFPSFDPTRHRPLVADATALGLADGTVSKVVSIDMLEHVEDPAAVLREMARVGALGARYMISVPDPAGEHLQAGLAPPAYFRKPNHLHVFERDRLEGMVAEAGLEVEDHRFTGFYWTLAMCMYWASRAHLPGFDGTEALSLTHPPFAPVLEHWAATWDAFMSLPGAKQGKEALNRLLPKNQIVLARKP